MIGLRIGPTVGLRAGFAVGIGADPIATDGTIALTVSLADSADPVAVSSNFNYTAVVTNVSAGTLTSVSAVITLDASLTFVSGSGAGWTVGAVGRVVTCTLASLAVGAAPTITITVTTGATPLTAATTADASATGAPNASQVTQNTAIQSAATTLTVALTDSADPVNAGTNYNYLAVVTNTGAVTATSVTAVINMDPSLTVVSGSGTGWTVSIFGQVVTCTRATLAVGAAPTITITVTPTSAVLVSSTADASATNASSATQATQTTQILTTLTVALTDNADPVITAANLIYSLVVTNTGSASATTVSAPVVLDASLTFVSGSGTGWTVVHSAGTVTCTRASLAVGAAPTVTITATTGGSALTASSNANASAANAAAATQSTQTTVVKLVARDATSLIRVPANLTQWQDFNAYHVAIGTANFPNVLPSLQWLCQEPSGNLTDSIGVFTGTVSGTPVTYQQPVTGWTRLGIAGVDAGTGVVGNTAAGLPDTATTSMLSLGYAIETSSANGNRFISVIGAGSTNIAFGGSFTFGVASVANSASGVANVSGAVRPYGVLYDVTNNRVAGWSDQEILSCARGATTTKQFRMFLGFPGSHLYRCAFFGAAAEITNAQIKALHVALGWSIPWT